MDNDREALAREIQEASDRIRSGESELEEIQLPNEGRLRIRRDPNVSGNVVVEADRDGITLRSIPFPAMEERPADYPEDVPFLPGTAGTLSQAGVEHARTMVWPSPADPDAGFETLLARISEAGWEETTRSEEATEDGDIQSVDFARNEATRSLFLQRIGEQAQLLVVDHPPKHLGTPE